MRITRTLIAAMCLAALSAGAVLIAQSSKPNGVVAMVNASILFEEQGDYAQALSQMEAAGGLLKDDYLISLRLGWLYYLNGNYPQAETQYRRAGELANGKSVEALLGLTLPLAARNEWLKVEQSYLRVLELDPVNYDANLRLGQIYANRSDHVRADKYFRTVLTGYPSNYEANLSAGWNYLNLGDKAAARLHLTRALMLSPADTSATRALEKLK